MSQTQLTDHKVYFRALILLIQIRQNSYRYTCIRIGMNDNINITGKVTCQ